MDSTNHSPYRIDWSRWHYHRSQYTNFARAVMKIYYVALLARQIRTEQNRTEPERRGTQSYRHKRKHKTVANIFMALHWLHFFHTDTAVCRHYYRLQMTFFNIIISHSVRGKCCIDSNRLHSILYFTSLLFFTSLHTNAADSTRDGQEETFYHFICTTKS